MIIFILGLLLKALFWLMLLSALLTWFPSLRWSPFGRLVYGITEPMLQPFRRLLGTIRFRNFGIDLSPIALMVAAGIAYYVLVHITIAVFKG